MKNLYRLRTAVLAFVMIVGAGQLAQAQTLPLGSPLPDTGISLTNTSGSAVTLSSLRGANGLAIVFWSNDCPWADRYEERVAALAKEYQSRGVNFVLVNTNDPKAFPKESMEESAKRASDKQYGMPYVLDSGSALGKALGAERSPHVFLFDRNDALAFVGTIDDSPGDPTNVKSAFMRDAVDAVASGKEVAVPHTKSFGCTLKMQR